MTRQALELLTFVRRLTKPQPLLLRDIGLPLAEQSSFTLLHTLFQDGWTLIIRNSGQRGDMPTIAVTPGPVSEGQKIIHKLQNNVSVPPKYLRCLAEINASSTFRGFLRENGVLSVKHGQPEKYYESLLSNNPDRILQVDFEPDVAVSDPALRDARASARAAVAGRFRIPESFRWGAVSFKYHKPGKGQLMGSLQCDCVRHSHRRKNSKGKPILCTWTCRYNSEEERVLLVRRMKHWATQGFEVSTHSEHQKLRTMILETPVAELPTDEALDAIEPPADRAVTDDEQDAAHAASSSAAPAVKSKSKSKAKPKSSISMKAKAGPKKRSTPATGSTGVRAPPPKTSRTAASPQDEAASDPESDERQSSAANSDSSDSSSSKASSSSSSSSDSGSSSGSKDSVCRAALWLQFVHGCI